MRIETERLLLRPWKESDAESLYTIAKDPHIGPLAGWLPHANKDDSRQIIKGILTAPEIYCITLKGEGEIIGSVGLHFDEESVIGLADNDVGKRIFKQKKTEPSSSRTIPSSIILLPLR